MNESGIARLPAVYVFLCFTIKELDTFKIILYTC